MKTTTLETTARDTWAASIPDPARRRIDAQFTRNVALLKSEFDRVGNYDALELTRSGIVRIKRAQ
jgi:hypothetical protein